MLILVALLILVIILMLKAPELTRTFSAIFFPSADTTGVVDE